MRIVLTAVTALLLMALGVGAVLAKGPPDDPGPQDEPGKPEDAGNPEGAGSSGGGIVQGGHETPNDLPTHAQGVVDAVWDRNAQIRALVAELRGVPRGPQLDLGIEAVVQQFADLLLLVRDAAHLETPGAGNVGISGAGGDGDGDDGPKGSGEHGKSGADHGDGDEDDQHDD